MTVILKDGVPFAGTTNLSPSTIAKHYDQGIWTDVDLAKYNLDAATSFVVPPGKVAVGSPRYVETGGAWHEEYDVIDYIPSAEEIRIKEFGAEPDVVNLLNQMDTATANQINTWINTNVTNLTQARDVLKTLTKLIVLTRRGL